VADSPGAAGTGGPPPAPAPAPSPSIPHREPVRCDSYDAGQCTWGACRLLSWVPDGWGNAQDWLAHARAAGFPVGDVPDVGAIAVYAGGLGYSPLGHLGLVEAIGPDRRFQVLEMNYTSWNAYDRRWSDLTDVAGFIFARGVVPPLTWPGQPAPPPARSGDLEAAWQAFADFWNQDADVDWDALQQTAGAVRALLPQ